MLLSGSMFRGLRLKMKFAHPFFLRFVVGSCEGVFEVSCVYFA